MGDADDVEEVGLVVEEVGMAEGEVVVLEMKLSTT